MVGAKEGEFTDHIDTDINELAGSVENDMPPNFDGSNGVSYSQSIVPVTKITIPNETTRECIAQQFTLNKNQTAAFMIITGHLDGLDKLNEGKAIKLKS